MKSFTISAILMALLAFGCKSSPEKVTESADYEPFILQNATAAVSMLNAEKDFWKGKVEAAPNQSPYFSKLAGAHAALFETTGTIENLIESEKLLLEASQKSNGQSAPLYRSLARNYISQHKFDKALFNLKKADSLGEGKTATQKMLFDVYMELGNYTLAEKKLSEIKNLDDFDYLIRLAKWNDHIGDLPTAITLMERATAKAEQSNNKALKLWSYSNLADFYGHAGRIEDSYKYYLKTLALDANYTYALKGIAWIVFSHEKNAKEAARIIDAVNQKHRTPDYFLLKAELASFEKDELNKTKYLLAYVKMAENPAYGDMYNNYNAALFADELSKPELAKEIAVQEIINRPTPESYDLLAWAEFKLGNTQKALEIVENHIVDKTFEPAILYHVAEIYKANGLTKKVKPLKKELLASLYELGPNIAESIHAL